MPRRIESHLIDGPAGRLEAILEEPESGVPIEACLICHPHPLGGGTMFNKVVHRMARAAREAGRVVLRFNFRGVGRSEGEHAGGIGEVEDARAALGWLRSRYPKLPYILAGFSFGSRVILRLGCELGDAEQLVAVGFPTTFDDFRFLETCALPKTFITSAHDRYAPVTKMEEWFAWFAPPKRLQWIEASDHFFAGALDELEAAITAALRAQPSAEQPA